MLSNKAFFSFTHVVNRADHHEYNAWHQLDHRPENLALPGVRHGERWVRTPDCAAAGTAVGPELDGLHYVNMYWFSEPAAESFRAWQGLAEQSFQWGRRPDTRISRRLLMGSFTPVKGYVSPRVLVSADALPFRPNRGVAITVSRVSEPLSIQAHHLYGWQDQVAIPELLSRPGVAGAWTFSSQSTTLDSGGSAEPASTTFDERSPEPGQFRILLVYLDADPLEYWSRRGEPSATPPGMASVLDGVLRSITPWQWDWFD
ncbi:MAG: hypothetical protein QOE61_4341 [Micromonosporaceae bacterium]|jgi:hypothetical protein|nr:hypothetical protein [Micromonosporaceae bacterium]